MLCFKCEKQAVGLVESNVGRSAAVFLSGRIQQSESEKKRVREGEKAEETHIQYCKLIFQQGRC